MKCLLKLNQQTLNQGNLKDYTKKLWKDFENNYNNTMIIIKSNFDKEFVFFFANKLEEANDSIETRNLFVYYWINNN